MPVSLHTACSNLLLYTSNTVSEIGVYKIRVSDPLETVSIYSTIIYFCYYSLFLFHIYIPFDVVALYSYKFSYYEFSCLSEQRIHRTSRFRPTINESCNNFTRARKRRLLPSLPLTPLHNSSSHNMYKDKHIQIEFIKTYTCLRLTQSSHSPRIPAVEQTAAMPFNIEANKLKSFPITFRFTVSITERMLVILHLQTLQ